MHGAHKKWYHLACTSTSNSRFFIVRLGSSLRKRFFLCFVLRCTDCTLVPGQNKPFPARSSIWCDTFLSAPEWIDLEPRRGFEWAEKEFNVEQMSSFRLLGMRQFELNYFYQMDQFGNELGKFVQALGLEASTVKICVV